MGFAASQKPREKERCSHVNCRVGISTPSNHSRWKQNRSLWPSPISPLIVLVNQSRVGGKHTVGCARLAPKATESAGCSRFMSSVDAVFNAILGTVGDPLLRATVVARLGLDLRQLSVLFDVRNVTIRDLAPVFEIGPVSHFDAVVCVREVWPEVVVAMDRDICRVVRLGCTHGVLDVIDRYDGRSVLDIVLRNRCGGDRGDRSGDRSARAIGGEGVK